MPPRRRPASALEQRLSQYPGAAGVVSDAVRLGRAPRPDTGATVSHHLDPAREQHATGPAPQRDLFRSRVQAPQDDGAGATGRERARPRSAAPRTLSLHAVSQDPRNMPRRRSIYDGPGPKSTLRPRSAQSTATLPASASRPASAAESAVMSHDILRSGSRKLFRGLQPGRTQSSAQSVAAGQLGNAPRVGLSSAASLSAARTDRRSRAQPDPRRSGASLDQPLPASRPLRSAGLWRDPSPLGRVPSAPVLIQQARLPPRGSAPPVPPVRRDGACRGLLQRLSHARAPTVGLSHVRTSH